MSSKSPDSPDAWSAPAAPSGSVDDLWRVHRRWLAAVLLAHMPNEADLDDLLQEVALIVMQKRHQLADETRLRPWLRTIAINTARRDAEDRRRQDLSLAESALQEVRDPAPVRAHRQGRVRSELAHVLRLVRRLSPEHKETLLLRGVEGLTQREIAETLSISEEAVESRLARARKKLREAMFKKSDSSLFPPPNRG